MENTSIYSSLKLEEIVFDKILFERQGLKNNSELETELQVTIGKNDKGDYRVSLILTGEKESEYKLEVGLSGFFTFENSNSIDESSIIRTNAVAILLPYLRSQVSLVTTQPNTDPVLLPILNINQLMKNY